MNVWVGVKTVRRHRPHHPRRLLDARAGAAGQRAAAGAARSGAGSRSCRPAATARRPRSPRTSTSPAAGTGRPTWSATRSSTTTPSTPRTTASGWSAGPCTTWCCRRTSRTRRRRAGGGAGRSEGLPYLKQVWGDANWQLFEVDDPTPLADPPATVERAEAGELTIEVKRAGRVLIRIPYSPWLGLVDAKGKSVQRAAGDARRPSAARTTTSRRRSTTSTGACSRRRGRGRRRVDGTARAAPGVYRLAAPYQLPRGTPCPEELKDRR